jgi:organic radical activating enzyme
MKNVMQKLNNHYNIPSSFYHRYFRQNAENRFAVMQLEFMLWRRGRFIRPQEKQEYLERVTAEEIENFYEKKEINLPQLQFAVTTRCSLQCRDCNALIPEFGRNGNEHITLTFADFKRDFDALMTAANSVRRFMLLGGEPLINKDLPDILDYCASRVGISAVEIVTNGTIPPSRRLLEAAREHAMKAYFHLSNYSGNEALRPLLKYDTIIGLLKENGIKHQMSMNLVWNREDPLLPRPYTQPELQAMFDGCWLKRCVQALDGKLSLCPRLSSGYALGLISPMEDECVDLRKSDTETLKQKLSEFYHKNCFSSCRYCVRIDEQIPPAVQRDAAEKNSENRRTCHA